MITIQELESLTRETLPFAGDYGFKVEHLGDGKATVRAPYSASFLRPGGTISGPVIMGLADYALFAAILSRLGRVELAVPTNLNDNFLRRTKPAAMIAKARLIKLGSPLAAGEDELY